MIAYLVLAAAALALLLHSWKKMHRGRARRPPASWACNHLLLVGLSIVALLSWATLFWFLLPPVWRSLVTFCTVDACC